VLLYLERYGVHTGTFVDQSSSSDGLMFGSYINNSLVNRLCFAAVWVREIETRFTLHGARDWLIYWSLARFTAWPF
jgi:hypothetical protein